MQAPPKSEHEVSSSRGGISGNSANPTIASAVMNARLLRHTGKTLGRRQNKHGEHGEGDDEVGGAVPGVPELDERPIGEEPLLDRRLVVEPDRLLEPDDPFGVVERLLGDAVGGDGVGAELVPDPRVQEVEAEDEQDLLPPPHDVGAFGDGVRLHLRTHLRHRSARLERSTVGAREHAGGSDHDRRSRRRAGGGGTALVRRRRHVHLERRTRLAAVRGRPESGRPGDRHPPRAVGDVRGRGLRQADANRRRGRVDGGPGDHQRRIGDHVGSVQRLAAGRARRTGAAGSMGRRFAAGTRPRADRRVDHQVGWHRDRPDPGRADGARRGGDGGRRLTAGRRSSTSRWTCSDRRRGGAGS